MSDNNTLNNWLLSINKKLDGQSFYNLDIDNNQELLPIINDDYLSLFKEIVNKTPFTFASLKDTTFIDNAMKEYLDSHIDEKVIFSSLDEKNQYELISKLISLNEESLKVDSYNKLYITFATLEFIIDNVHYKAPLVFVPIRIIQRDKKFILRSISDEIKLNIPLIETLKKHRKIDLSYPINSSFSLSEYLYYISVKVRPINWIVNNQNFISLFDFSYYNDFKMILDNQEVLKENQLVKKLSYFNSEFFSFSRNNLPPLESKYFSLLNIENEEYQLLKTIAYRDNLLVRTFKNANKYHFLNNVISSFLLNNKKVLVAYSSRSDKEELVKQLNQSGLSKYALDLDYQKVNKDDLLASLASYENLRINYNSLHPISIDEDLTKYYDIKNNFLSLMNGLRTNKNSIHTSINKLINNYYALNKLPLLDFTFKDIEKIDLNILEQYLQALDEFANSIKKLEMPVSEHPFYGFNKKRMLKDDYLPLKDEAISLSQTLNEALEIIKIGNREFNLPKVATLKEFKALLNVIHFISTYQEEGELSWLEEKNMNLPYKELIVLLKEMDKSQKEFEGVCKPYNEVLVHITRSNLDHYKNKKGVYNLKSFKKKYLDKKVPLQEVDSLIVKLEALVTIREGLEAQINKYDHSIVLYLKAHTIEELITKLDEIKLAYRNLNYIKELDGFNLVSRIKDYSHAFQKHYQAMQYSFNLVLDSSRILQEYFDKNLFDYEKISLEDYLKKVTGMSNNFSSINNYLNYYLVLNRINSISEHLGDELVKHPLDEFKHLFLKRFYFDLLTKYLNSKEFSTNLSRENIFGILDNFKDSDNKRKKIIERIIINNFHNNLRTKLASIKENEGREIRNILERKTYQMNLNTICDKFNESITNFKPLIMASYKDVSTFLMNKNYNFDVVIILSNRTMDIKEVLPCLVKSHQVLIVDDHEITNDIRSSIINVDDSYSLISVAKATCKEIRYNNESHSIYSLMKKNLYDLDFKSYLAHKLQEHGFDVGIDRLVKEQVIDILVKVKNSSSSVAIQVDHLPYYSPEEASNTFYYQEDFLKNIGYHPYRIFTALYFLDEENEFTRLVDYIVTVSRLIPERAIIKNSLHLTDYLFKEYVDPRTIYYQCDPRLSLEEKVVFFLNKVAPISLEEIRIVFKENVEEIINKLKKKDSIEIINNFIYIPNQKVEFRRVDRNKEFYRPLDLVSDKELYDAIFQIIDYKSSLNEDTLIKMILLSLGYKKYNGAKYHYLEEKIKYLVDNKIIFKDNDMLYKSL